MNKTQIPNLNKLIKNSIYIIINYGTKHILNSTLEREGTSLVNNVEGAVNNVMELEGVISICKALYVYRSILLVTKIFTKFIKLIFWRIKSNKKGPEK